MVLSQTLYAGYSTMGGNRFKRPSLLASALVPCLVAYFLHYALLPVPDDLNTVDKIMMKVIAPGIDIGRWSETLESPLRYMGFNFAVYMLGAWIIRDVTYTDTSLNGVKVRIYEPKKRAPGPIPAIVYLHGGGWVYGNAWTYHGLTGYLASKLQIVLISVDYRNPPDHVFPAAIDDATSVTAWFLRHADKYNVDSSRIALVGDSAGGNLAAAVAQRLTFQEEHRQLPKLKFQGLIYPVLQAFDFDLPSYQQNGDQSTLILRKRMMVEFWSMYLVGDHSLVEHFMTNNHTSAAAKTISFQSDIMSHLGIPQRFKYKPYAPSTSQMAIGDETVYNRIERTLLDPDFAPLMRANLTGLPKAYVLTAQHDLLRDEGIMYVQRLESAGVHVTWKHYKHGVHGIFSMFATPGISIAAGRKCMKDFLSFTRKELSISDES